MVFIKIGHRLASFYLFGEKLYLNVFCPESWYGHDVQPRIANTRLDNKQCYKLPILMKICLKKKYLSTLLGKSHIHCEYRAVDKSEGEGKGKKKKQTFDCSLSAVQC